MAMHRPARVGELLLSFLAEQLRRLGDPRLGAVTLTGIDVSPDLKSAKIFWATHEQQATAGVVETEESIERVSEALRHASGLLKHRIGEELRLRFTPNLRFYHDNSLNTGARIDELLRAARNRSTGNGDDIA